MQVLDLAGLDGLYEAYNLILIGFGYLAFKHLLADFLYQPPYQFQNKGKYGHPGGLLHAGQHMLASAPLFAYFVYVLDYGTNLEFLIWMAVITVVAEGIIHYHMDWFKMWWGARKGYKCNQHAEFWHWMGFDQFVHTMTYIAMMTPWGWAILAHGLYLR